MLLLTYISRARKHYSSAELDGMCASFAQTNLRLDITGLLLLTGDHFIQFLEGDKRVVLELAQHISQDIRHTDYRELYQHPIQSRRFGQWAMRWLRLEDEYLLSAGDLQRLREMVRSYAGRDQAPKSAMMELIRSIPPALQQHRAP